MIDRIHPSLVSHFRHIDRRLDDPLDYSSAYRAEEETDYTSLFTKRFGDKEETMNTATKTPFSVPTNETVGSDSESMARILNDSE